MPSGDSPKWLRSSRGNSSILLRAMGLGGVQYFSLQGLCDCRQVTRPLEASVFLCYLGTTRSCLAEELGGSRRRPGMLLAHRLPHSEAAAAELSRDAGLRRGSEAQELNTSVLTAATSVFSASSAALQPGSVQPAWQPPPSQELHLLMD